MKIRIDPLDKQFSLYIRSRANWKCEKCGTQYIPPTAGLQCSHFVGRANQQTRYDDKNCSALCFHCHQYFTANPYEHTEWMRKKLGDKEFEALNRRANWRSGKVDKKLIKLWLDKIMAKEIQTDDKPIKEKKRKVCAHRGIVGVSCFMTSCGWKKPKKK